MKITKRLLCVLLSLVLGVLFLPVGAAAEAIIQADPNPNVPIIKRQPMISKPVQAPAIRVGKSFTLTAEAYLPESSNGALSYDWYEGDWEPGTDAQPIATGATVEIVATKETFENSVLIVGAFVEYCVVVTNTYTDADGTVQTISIKSDPVSVMLAGNVFTAATSIWKFSCNTFGLGSTIILSPFMIIMSLLSFMISPLYYLIALVAERQV